MHFRATFVLATVILSRASRKYHVWSRSGILLTTVRGPAAGLHQLRVFAHWSILTYHEAREGSPRILHGLWYKRRPRLHRTSCNTAVPTVIEKDLFFVVKRPQRRSSGKRIGGFNIVNVAKIDKEFRAKETSMKSSSSLWKNYTELVSWLTKLIKLYHCYEFPLKI